MSNFGVNQRVLVHTPKLFSTDSTEAIIVSVEEPSPDRQRLDDVLVRVELTGEEIQFSPDGFERYSIFRPRFITPPFVDDGEPTWVERLFTKFFGEPAAAPA